MKVGPSEPPCPPLAERHKQLQAFARAVQMPSGNTKTLACYVQDLAFSSLDKHSCLLSSSSHSSCLRCLAWPPLTRKSGHTAKWHRVRQMPPTRPARRMCS